LLGGLGQELSGVSDAFRLKIEECFRTIARRIARCLEEARERGELPGTNAYVCIPDDPAVPNNSPMCLDAPWLELIDAWMNQRQPQVTELGISYMLQGDMPVSNVDPFATEPTPENDWIDAGPPHLMIVTPDLSWLDALPTDHTNGGPWVMWKGTPYAHVMVPTVPRAP
jgi:hypothetical protein